MISEKLLEVLACPSCKSAIQFKNGKIVCEKCRKAFPIKDDIPVMLIEEAEDTAQK